jgi:hypothetical protein
LRRIDPGCARLVLKDMLVAVMELAAWPSDHCLEEHCGITIHSFISCATVKEKGGEAKQSQRPEPVSAKLETTAQLGLKSVESAAEEALYLPRSGRIFRTPTRTSNNKSASVYRLHSIGAVLCACRVSSLAQDPPVLYVCSRRWRAAVPSKMLHCTRPCSYRSSC